MGKLAYTIARDLRRTGLDGLRDWLAQQGITVWHSTPTVFRLATANFAEPAPVSLRAVILGGEEALPTDLALLGKHFTPDCLLVNGFGPTESSVTLQYFTNAQTKPRSGRLSIGYPVEATRAILLDKHGIPTEFVGEIAIRSAHVALGYLKRPGLTAERFIPNPFGNGERVYRTGDLARWREDGNLEFLGRIDHQVKVRGYRIELAEIETVLGAHPSVGQAVVVAREDEPGEKRLVAYVVGEDGVAPEVNGLRAHLKQRLPDYMVPSAFVIVSALPLTPSGKIDRRALPAPEGRPAVSEYVAPRTGVEEVLAGIWCEVLKLERVGAHDNFFELGGHSLMAMRVIARVRDVLGVELPLRVLFKEADLTETANAIHAVMLSRSGTSDQTGDWEEMSFLVTGQ